MALPPEPVRDPRLWDDLVSAQPHGHLLQSWAWGELKAKYGWRPDRLTWRDPQGRPIAAAQVLERSLRLPGLRPAFSVLYCPRGPVLDWTDAARRAEVLASLQALAARPGTLFLKIDPDLPVGYGPSDGPGAETDPAGAAVTQELSAAGWRPSAEQVQFRNTLLIDLERPEGEILAGMKPKTRYNIHLAERQGVAVRPGGAEDLDRLYAMYAETSLRDGFVIRSPDYYRDAWGSFVAAGLAQAFVAEVAGEPVAGLLAYRFGRTAWYLYGMSRRAHREKMPNHLLQWQAIRWARAQGCAVYDLWGAPDRFDPSDPLWGVYRFKLGFGARLVRTLGAWDYTVRPRAYWLYTAALPRLLALMRARGRTATRRSLLET